MNIKTLLLGTFSLLAASIPILQAPSVHIGLPPVQLAQSSHASVFFKHPQGLVSELTYHMHDRLVRIRWGNNAQTYATQEIALSYWPTAAIQLDSDTIMVAGKARGGNTVVEEIELVLPSLLVVLENGTPKTRLLGARVSSVTNLYDQADVGRDMIDLLIADPYSADSVIARFHSTHDVYRIHHSATPSVATVFATAIDTGLGVEVQAGLDWEYKLAWTGTHGDLGQVFVFADAEFEKDSVVLFDGDGDGIIDNSLIATPSVWEALDLGDPDKYF